MRVIDTPVLGATWLEITSTARGVVVGCPGCGAQQLFEAEDELVFAHAHADCAVFRASAGAFRWFLDTNEVRS
jgi:hypothetical protein